MARRSLAGARVLVTGASSGIGRAIAMEFAKRGARLLITARRQDRLEELATEISHAGGVCLVEAGDIVDASFRQRLLVAVQSQFGALDVLINNAGIGAIGPFAEANEQRLRQIMEVNFFAPVETMRAALPLLRAGQRPIIVNVGSVLGHRAVPSKSEYCASKFALHGFSDALRCELAAEKIDVLLVSPSTTASEFFDNVVDGKERPRPRSFGSMSPAEVARQTANATEAGRHEIILSWGGKLLVWLDRLCPSLMNWVLRD